MKGTTMAEEGFRLPGSSYEELSRIIKAYGHTTGEVSPGDVSKYAAIPETTVSRNAAFLVSLAVLAEGKARKKIPTDAGRRLAQALDHDMKAEVAEAWRAIVLASEFMTSVLTAIRVRGGMDLGALQSHIAYTAGQPCNKGTMTGARTVVDVLRAADVITEQDGALVAATVTERAPGVGPTRGDLAQPPAEPTAALSRSVSWYTAGRRSSGQEEPVNLTLEIQLHVQATPDDLPQLAAKLRALLRDLQREEDVAGDLESSPGSDEVPR